MGIAGYGHETFTAMRVAGERSGGQRSRFEVYNPYSEEVVAEVPRAKPKDIEQAFASAAAFKPQLTRYQRQQILLATAASIKAQAEQLSDLITAESGLSKKDSRYEVGRAYDVFSITGNLCLIDDAESFACDISPHGQARRVFTQREPLSAISAITPFNHPLNMVAHKIAPAIATNNCVVLKPTEKTPLTALALADILYEAGLPPPMYSVVTGLPNEIGAAMVNTPYAELITFTGSVRVGKLIAEKAGYRRTVLELGGNDPLCVLEDADLSRAAELAVAGATKNSGQRCTAVKRVLCVESVADEFVELLLERVSKLRFGDPMDEITDVGTVIDQSAAQLFEQRVAHACSLGAKLLYGNQRQGALYSPTLVDHVPFDAELVREETFGPVLPVIRVADIDQLIAVSNSTAYGLSSGVCTNRFDYIQKIIAGLQVGTVNVWEVPGYRTEMSPFGGVKDSGLGYKEGVWESMRAYTTIKTFSLPWGI